MFFSACTSTRQAWSLDDLPGEIATEYFAAIVSNGGTISSQNQTKVLTLLNGLQAAGIYRKVRALYLYHGNTLNAARLNVINPTTYLGSHVITWTGTPTLDADGGMTPSGGTNLGITNFHPDGGGLTLITGGGLGFYGTAVITGDEYPIGTFPGFWLSPLASGSSRAGFSGTTQAGTSKSSLGFLYGCREPNSTAIKAYHNGTKFIDSTTAFVTAYNTTAAARIAVGTFQEGAAPSGPFNPSAIPHKLSIITMGLTEGEVADLNTLVQAYAA